MVPSPIQNTLAAAGETGSALGLPGGPDLTSYVAVCALLLGAIALLAWGFRKLFVGGLRARAARRSLRVIDMLPLGAKRSLAVVQCYDRTLLIGLGDKDVSLLTELDLEAGLAVAPARAVADAAAGGQADAREPRPKRAGRGPRPDAAEPAPERSFGAALHAALDRGTAGESRASRAEGILRALRRGEGVVG